MLAMVLAQANASLRLPYRAYVDDRLAVCKDIGVLQFVGRNDPRECLYYCHDLACGVGVCAAVEIHVVAVADDAVVSAPECTFFEHMG
eukprot:49083-Pyramimonas_sp.AAC.1